MVPATFFAEDIVELMNDALGLSTFGSGCAWPAAASSSHSLSESWSMGARLLLCTPARPRVAAAGTSASLALGKRPDAVLTASSSSAFLRRPIARLQQSNSQQSRRKNGFSSVFVDRRRDRRKRVNCYRKRMRLQIFSLPFFLFLLNQQPQKDFLLTVTA